MSGALTALCFKTRDEVRSRGVYTQSVEEQALSGVILFLMSEAMLFAAFF
jgi:heme/copper-type cytochrome/quinol oxidase subunit 3